MSVKVEFGFDKNSSGAYVYQDVTSYVKSVSIDRGKQNSLTPYSAGQASVDLDNRSRAFDPTYTGSPYYGQVKPIGGLRISRENIQLFEGVINDWNLSYSLDGQSLASISASDAFSVFTNQNFTDPPPSFGRELSSTRLNNILNTAGWSATKRRISTGLAYLTPDDPGVGDALLDYMQKIEKSEAGRLFMDSLGNLVFKTRNDNAFASAYSYTRKNLSLNPTFFVDTSHWTATSGSITRSTATAYSGTASGLVGASSVLEHEFTQETSTSYCLSVYVKAVSGSTSVTLSAWDSPDDSTYTQRATTAVSVTSAEWTRINVNYISDYSSTHGQLRFSNVGAVYIDSILIEASASLNDYFDGSVTPTDDAVTTYTSSWDI